MNESYDWTDLINVASSAHFSWFIRRSTDFHYYLFIVNVIIFGVVWVHVNIHDSRSDNNKQEQHRKHQQKVQFEHDMVYNVLSTIGCSVYALPYASTRTPTIDSYGF